MQKHFTIKKMKTLNQNIVNNWKWKNTTLYKQTTYIYTYTYRIASSKQIIHEELEKNTQTKVNTEFLVKLDRGLIPGRGYLIGMSQTRASQVQSANGNTTDEKTHQMQTHAWKHLQTK
jgi:hypothetical protein